MKCVTHIDVDAAAKCLSCGNPICEACQVASKHEVYCKACIAKKAEGASEYKRSPALAAMLSFILAGAGQIYNGQWGKGLLILLTSWLVLPWVYGIFDAYGTAKKISEGTITAKSASGCAVAFIAGIVLLFFFIAILGILAAIAIPNFIKAREAAMKNAGMNMPSPSARSQAAKILPIKRQVKMVRVFLKNGHFFEAEMDSEIGDEIVFRITGGTFTIEKEDIQNIEKLY